MPTEATELSRFDRTRRTLGLFLAPLLFVVVLATPSTLDAPAHRLAAVFALVIALWVSEAIPLPVTALLGPALAVLLGVAGARETFAYFGREIIFLFLGSFLIARAMSEHGLDRRIALFVLSRRVVGEHPGRILLAFGVVGAALSMWMSNTATAAMMLPIGIGVLKTLPRGAGGRYPVALFLMIAFSCSIGGLATPVGTPPNLIAIGFLEEYLHRDISFVDWMRYGIPVSAACFVVLFVLLRRVLGVGAGRIEGASRVIREARATLGPWSAGEKAALLAFVVAVALWTLPGAASMVAGDGSPAVERLTRALPEGPAAILAASLLFLVPVDWRARRFALGWREAAGIDWGTILLFGGGLALGGLASTTGLAEAAGGAILARTGGLSLAILVLIAVFVANLVTEFVSNTATATVLVPLFLSVSATGPDNAILPAVAATLGCSLAFSLPVATPPNAIVYGSGQVPLVQMIRLGVILDVACGLATWAVLMLIGRWVA